MSGLVGEGNLNVQTARLFRDREKKIPWSAQPGTIFHRASAGFFAPGRCGSFRALPIVR
jgi:hypothetical protein